MAQTNINIRMDEDLKKQFEAFCAEVGLNMTTAFNVFARATVRQQRIPFEIAAETDPFYSDVNQKRLKNSIAELKQSKFIVKTMDELEAMERE